MVTVFGLLALFVLAAIVIGMARFWRLVGAPPIREIGLREIGRALHDACTLKYLGGGADLGCTYPDEAPSKLRRLFHHFTFYRSEEHTSELQSLMRISYAVFCLKKKKST